jgi:hypothetical protein
MKYPLELAAGFLLGAATLSLCPISRAQSSDRAYELKGETPGITTLKEFKKNHRHADCTNRTTNRTACRVYDGVSFAGSNALTFKGCGDLQCVAQGIAADFVDGTLVSLTYGVMLGGEVVASLKAKYGEPARQGDLFSWKNSIGSLTVSTSGLTTSITSSLNNKGEKNDI